MRPRAREIQTEAIGEHALIGDTRTGALISRRGNIDWMCIPRFDRDPIFGSLVDPDHGGEFSLSFGTVDRIERSYMDRSAVLETISYLPTGVARSTEGMVANVTDSSLPQSLLIRRVECIEGQVRLKVRFDPRRGMPGRAPARIRYMPAHAAVICEWGSLAVCLQCDPPLPIEPGVETSVAIGQGEVATFTMSIADRCPVTLVRSQRSQDLLVSTAEWWRRWTDAIEYEGPYRHAVVRSLLTLRLLTYSPSGAPVAAPTTSLPEEIGGDRNWDYRFSWPRDAAIGLAAFLATGNTAMADSFMHWLLHASRLTRPRLRVLYDVHGRKAPPESEVEVSGHRRSVPVRTGNAADEQHQLDIYGWVVDAASLLEASGHRLHNEIWRAVAGFADVAARMWREPDAGLWEVRGKPEHYVHSKLMAWLALDRAAQVAKNHRIRRSRLEGWLRERDAIAVEVRAKGVDRERGTLVWRYGSPALDASLLLLPILGFEPADSPLTKATIKAVREDLEVEPGFLYRYPPAADGLEGQEGAFLPCSFWLIQALARTGDIEEATALFDRVLGFANDVGLWSEELGPEDKQALGNYPQAFTHAALVQAAVAIEEAKRRKVA